MRNAISSGRVARNAGDEGGEDVADADANARERDDGDTSPEGLCGCNVHNS